MGQEKRRVVWDADLGLEAYHFSGLQQTFPNHFHEYWVVGTVVKGHRHLTCKNERYEIAPGDLVVFSPGVNHACEQISEELLDWRCLNIREEVLCGLAGLPSGGQPVIEGPVQVGSGASKRLAELHRMVMEGSPALEKQEAALLLFSELVQSGPREEGQEAGRVQEAIGWLRKNYAAQVSLDQLAMRAGMNKYTLLRAFTRETGLTPYQYLQTLRIEEAKRLLEDGEGVAETALATGFADQSHFTRYFKSLTGVTPGQYQTIFKDGDKDGGKVCDGDR